LSEKGQESFENRRPSISRREVPGRAIKKAEKPSLKRSGVEQGKKRTKGTVLNQPEEGGGKEGGKPIWSSYKKKEKKREKKVASEGVEVAGKGRSYSFETFHREPGGEGPRERWGQSDHKKA